MLNCTPHEITIRVNGSDRVFQISGIVARVGCIDAPAVDFDGIPVVTRSMGAVEGLPRNASGHVLPCIVSGMVLDALKSCATRDGNALSGIVFAPDSGSTAIRSGNGQIIAVTRLVTL